MKAIAVTNHNGRFGELIAGVEYEFGEDPVRLRALAEGFLVEVPDDAPDLEALLDEDELEDPDEQPAAPVEPAGPAVDPWGAPAPAAETPSLTTESSEPQTEPEPTTSAVTPTPPAEAPLEAPVPPAKTTGRKAPAKATPAKGSKTPRAKRS